MVFLNVIARTLASLEGGTSLVLLPSRLLVSILLHFTVPLDILDISPLLPCQVQC
jgi:hypothetical protein